MKPFHLSRSAWSWAFYDWANSAFVLSVITVFYGGVFENYWYDGDRPLFWQGVSVTGSSLLIALAAPFLGSIADSGPVKKRWLARFEVLGILSTVGLALLPGGAWMGAIFLRFTASLGFFGSLVFYDALLVDVSTPRNRHLVSGLGFSIGYLGSVLLLVAQFAILKRPELVGLGTPLAATKVAFLSVALWWTLFTLPLLRWVKEPDTRTAPPLGAALRHGGTHLRANFKALVRHRPAFLFLLAYVFYIDGVNTFMQMVAAFAARLEIPSTDLIEAIMLVQVVGVPCAVLLGWLGQHFRPKFLLLGCLGVYLGVTVYASRFSGEAVVLWGMEIKEIYLLGLLIGMVQGGLQSLSRSTFANLIPPEKSAAFFGFYNMLGKGGAIMGPILMSGVGTLTGDARWGALALAILFIAGMALLVRCPTRAAAIS